MSEKLETANICMTLRLKHSVFV